MKNKDLINLYVEEQNSPNTQKRYFVILNDFLEYVESFDQLDFPKYIEWKSSLKSKSISTQKQILTVTKCFLNWCFENYDLIDASLLLKINHIKLPRGNSKPTESLSIEQINKMIEHGKNIRDKAIIAILCSTGMRVSELINIRLSDIIDNKILVKGKGSKYRWVYPNEKAWELVNEYIHTFREQKIKRKHLDTDILFISNNGTPMKSSVLNATWKNIAARCGININIHNHTFRHTMATSMINQGVPIESVQNILGHADVSTTQIYAVKSIDQIQKEIKNVSVF